MDSSPRNNPMGIGLRVINHSWSILQETHFQSSTSCLFFLQLNQDIQVRSNEAQREQRRKEKLDRELKQSKTELEQKTNEIKGMQTQSTRYRDDISRLETQLKEQKVIIIIEKFLYCAMHFLKIVKDRKRVDKTITQTLNLFIEKLRFKLTTDLALFRWQRYCAIKMERCMSSKSIS